MSKYFAGLRVLSRLLPNVNWINVVCCLLLFTLYRKFFSWQVQPRQAAATAGASLLPLLHIFLLTELPTKSRLAQKQQQQQRVEKQTQIQRERKYKQTERLMNGAAERQTDGKLWCKHTKLVRAIARFGATETNQLTARVVPQRQEEWKWKDRSR